MKKTLAILLALIMMFSTVFVASAEESKDTLRIAMNKNITSLNGMSGTAQGFTPAFEIFDVLAALTPDMSLRPNLATAWEHIDDNTWRFTLREGVKFHDGREFTAEDAAYSINYIASINYSIKGQWATSWPPEGKVIDTYTFDIVTPAPNLKLPELLNRVPIIPKGCMEENEDFFKTPVGTGPYKFVSWDAGVNIVLEANPEYWDGEPAIKNLIFYTVPNSEARDIGLKSGEYDYVTGVGYDVATEIAEKDGTYGMSLDVIESTGHSYVFYNYNSENKFIQDVNFRKALTYAIDQPAIAEAILYGYATPSLGLSPQNVGAAVNAGGFPAQDVEKAKELLSACGYDGTEIKIYSNGENFVNNMEVFEVILSMLQDVGVNAKLYEVDGSQWDDIKASGSWDIGSNNLGGTYTGDSELYYTQSLVKQFWKIPEADEMVDSLYQPGITDEQRETTLKELMQFCWDQCPFLWSVDQTLLCARDSHLKGVEVLPMGIYRFTYAYFE